MQRFQEILENSGSSQWKSRRLLSMSHLWQPAFQRDSSVVLSCKRRWAFLSPSDVQSFSYRKVSISGPLYLSPRRPSERAGNGLGLLTGKVLSLIQAVPGFPGCVQRALKSLRLSSLVPCHKSPAALRLQLRLLIKSGAMAGGHRCSFVTHRLMEGSSYPGTREVSQPGRFYTFTIRDVYTPLWGLFSKEESILWILWSAARHRNVLPCAIICLQDEWKSLASQAPTWRCEKYCTASGCWEPCRWPLPSPEGFFFCFGFLGFFFFSFVFCF